MRVLVLLTFFIFSLAASSELKKLQLQLQWKHQFQFAGYYIAKEKGFYSEAGFDVDILEYESGINVADQVINNKVEFGTGRSTLVINRSHGENVTLLAAVFQSSPNVIIALKKSGINSIEEFKNKKVMITNDAKTDSTIMSMIFSRGLTKNDLIQMQHSFSVDDLINNKTDLMSAYISNEPFILQEKGFESVIFDPKDYGFDFYNDILFTSQEYSQKNPIEVKKFTEASLRGWRYAFENIEETVDLIYEKYNTQNKSRESLIFEGNELKKLAYYKTKELGALNKEKIVSIFNYYKLMGFIKDEIDFDTFIFRYDVCKDLKALLTDKELQWLKNNPKIRVSNEFDYPPFDFSVEKIPQGFSIDLLHLIAKMINIELEYINGDTWDHLIQKFKNNELDLLHTLNITNKREKLGNFSLPYMHYKNYIFTTKENSHIKTIDQLYGKTVVIGKSWSIESYLQKNHPQVNLLRVDNLKEMVLAVSQGRADALINDRYATNYCIKKYGFENIAVSSWFKEFDNYEYKTYHFMAQKGHPELISIINKAMTLIPQEEIESLKKRWLDDMNLGLLSNLTLKEKEYLKKKKSIKVCIDPSWMPFESFDKDKKHIGITADYFNLFERKLPTTFSVVQTDTWSESIKFAKERKCDLFSLAMETPERKKYMNFTTPYLEIPLVIATKLDVSFIDNLESLQFKRVAIPKGYAFTEIFKKKYPNIELIEVENVDEGLEKVTKNEVFGYIGTLASVGYKFQTKFNGELKIAGKFDEKWKLGVAVRNDDLVLLNILQKTIDSLDPKVQQKILNDWVSITYETKTDYDLMLKTIMGFIIVISIILFYLDKLNSLKRKLQETNKSLKKFIDTQESIIILTDGDNLKFANKSFLDFFGLEDIDDFSKIHKCLCETFIEDEQFFHMNKLGANENWINYLLKLEDTERLVAMYAKHSSREIFSVSISKYDDKFYIVTFTNVTETVMRNLKLHDKSIRDTLTNAFNREYLLQNARSIIADAKKSSYQLGFAFLDIDHFKQVNDTHGHDVGDDVLVHFVNTLNGALRSDDILIRWGGEEFVLILKVKSEKSFAKVLEHLRQTIESTTFPVVGTKTCSIGGTIYKNNEKIEDTIKRVDKNVYTAKERGRNTVVVS